MDTGPEKNTKQLFSKVEVNSGEYLLSRESSSDTERNNCLVYNNSTKVIQNKKKLIKALCMLKALRRYKRSLFLAKNCILTLKNFYATFILVAFLYYRVWLFLVFQLSPPKPWQNGSLTLPFCCKLYIYCFGSRYCSISTVCKPIRLHVLRTLLNCYILNMYDHWYCKKVINFVCSQFTM